MIAAIAAAALANHQAALYRAHLIRLPTNLHRRCLHLLDARKDFSASGYTYDHGGDWRSQVPLIVLKGKVVNYRHEESGVLKWTPAAILSDETIAVLSSDGKHARRAVISDGGMQVGAELRAAKLRYSPRLERPLDSESIDLPQDWWQYRHANPNGYRPGEPLAVNWFVMGLNVSVGDGHYRPILDGQLVVGAEFGFPLLRRGSITRPLREFVDPPNLDLGEIGFVSPDGWIIVRLEGKDGLAWLLPA